MTEEYVPSDEVIRKTLWHGYVIAMQASGFEPKPEDEFFADFDRWVAAKIAQSPEAEFVRKYGAEWDSVESTDGYMAFADDVGTALDRIRGKK